MTPEGDNEQYRRDSVPIAELFHSGMNDSGGVEAVLIERVSRSRRVP